MRIAPRLSVLLPLLALVALPGCVDGLGTSTECAAEMERVRRNHGPPSRAEEGFNQEIWFYDAERIYFEFSWIGGGCQVRGPSRFSLSPEPAA